MLRALELFCGIGGFAASVRGYPLRIAGAFDQSPAAMEVYRANFPGHPTRMANLRGAKAEDLAGYRADFWWMSPPCQPYGVRGNQRDLEDCRAGSFLRVLSLFAALPQERLPLHLALENVAGFAGCDAQRRLTDLLTARGYRVEDAFLCPTELGVPSRRPRYYLAASREPLAPFDFPRAEVLSPLRSYLDPQIPEALDRDLRLAPSVLERFGPGFSILDADDPAAYTACFTSAYGRSLMHSGSYLRAGQGVRRFSPEEIARLLHFPSDFQFPRQMSLRMKWRLLGNSLSVAAVRQVLKAFPALRPPCL